MSNTEDTQAIAASKAGMDVKTVRKYLRTRRLPGEMKVDRHWLTRQDGVCRGLAGHCGTSPEVSAAASGVGGATEDEQPIDTDRPKSGARPQAAVRLKAAGEPETALQAASNAA